MADAPPTARRRPRRSPSADAMPGGSPGAGAGQSDPAGVGADSPPPPRPKVTAPGSGAQGLQRRLEDLFSSGALVFAATGDLYCADVIAKGAPALAESWANLAKENPAIKRTLERMLTGGAWGGVIVSTLTIAWPIAAHHGLAPMPLLAPPGVTPIVPDPPEPSAGEALAGDAFAMPPAKETNGNSSPAPHPDAQPAPGPAAVSLPDAPPRA